MLYTLADARTHVNKFVENGTCSDRQVVDDRINEAQRRLLVKANWKSTTFRMRYFTTSNVITLPREAERIINVTIDMNPRRVFGQAYEFLENGPGELNPRDGYGSDLLDLGDGWPTCFDLPVTDEFPTMRIIAFSTAAADVGSTITIRGVDSRNAEIFTGTTPGEAIPINHWSGGVEGTFAATNCAYGSQLFRNILSVHKTASTGFVSIYGYDPTTYRLYFLSKYHPKETVPGYHRYRLTAPDEDNKRNVLCWVKRKFVPLSHATDILPVQSLDALKAMIIAIREENDKNLATATNYEAKAYLILNDELSDDQSDAVGIQWQDQFGLGSVPNII